MSEPGADAMRDEIERYESYVEADPENSLLWISLGDLYHRAGRFDNAIACYEKCLLFDEDDLVARSHLANALISQHRFTAAEQVLDSVLRATPDDPVLLHNLGLTRFYQRRWADALDAFRAAHDHGLEDTRNLEYLVYATHHSDDTDGALALARQWLEAAPGPRTEGYVSMLEMDHGDMHAATERAQNVLRQEPDNPDASIVVGTWQIEQQEIDAAIEYFERVIRIEPDSPRGWQSLGMAYLYQRDFPRAIATFEKALTFMPDSATTFLLIGWAQLASKDAVAAERRFRQAIEADRNFGEAHGGLATALIFQNRQQEAREEIKRSLKLDPDGFGAVFANSIFLKLQGKGNMADKMLGRLFEQTPRKGEKPLIDYIQTFVRHEAAKQPGKDGSDGA